MLRFTVLFTRPRTFFLASSSQGAAAAASNQITLNNPTCWLNINIIFYRLDWIEFPTIRAQPLEFYSADLPVYRR